VRKVAVHAVKTALIYLGDPLEVLGAVPRHDHDLRGE